MNERTRVQNPLTIIAIFAGIAEIAGTTVLLGLPLEIQKIFVWFVIIFPFLLVGAFFTVLLFKHRVLYAPSDFSNEEHFIALLQERYTAKQAIAETNDIVDELKELTKSHASNSEVLDVVRKRLVEIEGELENTTLMYENDKNINFNYDNKFNNLQHTISMKLNLLMYEKINELLKAHYPEGKTFSEIKNHFVGKVDNNIIINTLENMMKNRDIIKHSNE
ncbi:hypothetical protein PaeCFBP13512_19700, partial [Paenibacillus sp. CFBP13512]|uniref:hypothetical protein n=1 Tax=Paenibacillus sp. CFBP13512 TaxID=2184007 RepID=UPI00113FA381